MEVLKKVPVVNLVIEHADGTKENIKFRNQSGNLQDEIELSMLDYMISSYRDLEHYLDKALSSHWFDPKDSTIKIVGKDGREYPLPFENNNRDVIFRCSESAIYGGGKYYITKGDKPHEVSNQEFLDFFTEFLSNVLSDEGIELINKGYFSKDTFNQLLIRYYNYKEKDDDIYAQMNAASLEKGFTVSKNAPISIEDYLRYYLLFREGISFNIECKVKRNKKEVEEEKIRREEKKSEDIKPSKVAYFVKQSSSDDFALKRSLCFIIGNNCEPLILKTDNPEELDDYIVDNYKSSKEIRRAFKDEITAYVYAHKEYVKQIRELIHNSSYSGQVAILAHDSEGNFIRTSDGAYYRYPVIYSTTFKNVRKLYCNIERFKRQYKEEKKNFERLENEELVAKSRLAYNDLEEGLKEAIAQLEEAKKISKASLQELNQKITGIIETMKDLEQADYNATLENARRNRIFSRRIANIIGFARFTTIDKRYKGALDDWAKQIVDSPYRYDYIRFIMRELRKKNNFVLEDKDNVNKLDDADQSRLNVYNTMHIKSDDDIDYDRHEHESFLYEDEYKEMYEDGVPKDIDTSSIHVMGPRK